MKMRAVAPFFALALCFAGPALPQPAAPAAPSAASPALPPTQAPETNNAPLVKTPGATPSVQQPPTATTPPTQSSATPNGPQVVPAPPTAPVAPSPTPAPPIQTGVTPPAQAAAPPAGGGISLSYDIPESEQRSIAEEISVNLIDLKGLESALENQPGYQPVRMSLDECIQLALQQNDDVLIAQIEPLRANAEVFAARGQFDPVLQGKFNYTHSQITASQQILTFGGISNIESFNSTLTGGIVGKTPYGTQYGMTMNVDKEETTFGNFIEQFDTNLTFTLTQPLLRGFGKKVNTFQVMAAKNGRVASEHQLRLSIMNAVAQTVKAYWDLAGATDSLRVRRDSLENAERLLKISESRRRIGTAADIEVLQAKAGVAARQSELIAARTQVSAASDVLKRLINLRNGERFSTALIVPTDRPNVETVDAIEADKTEQAVEESVAKALANRSELTLADLEIENAQLQAGKARNDMQPQFDVTSSYTTGGRDHKLRAALQKMRDDTQNVFNFGLQGAIPLGNRAGRGAYERAKLSVRQAELRKQKALQDIQANVHLASRSVFSNQILVESNRQASRLQQANVSAEEKRLKLGVTTSWQVLKVQEDLTLAETQLVQAVAAYEKARTDLRLAEGTLLEDLGLKLLMPNDEKPVGYFQSIAPRWADDGETRKEYWERKGKWFTDPHLPARPGDAHKAKDDDSGDSKGKEDEKKPESKEETLQTPAAQAK